MNNVNRIKSKVEQIERLVSEIKQELESLAQEKPAEAVKIRRKEIIPPDEELKLEHEKLFNDFMNQDQQKINEFISGKSKNYLKSFCKVNNLPLDTTKLSKDKIAAEVIQWMAQRKAISQKIT